MHDILKEQRIRVLATKLKDDPFSLTVAETVELCRALAQGIQGKTQEEREALWRSAMIAY